MQTTVIYFGLAINWLLLIVSILLAVFSKFKHTQFKHKSTLTFVRTSWG